MNKKEFIDSILLNAKIHHNISTLGMKLPEAPENAPNELFWDACGYLVSSLASEVSEWPENDKGNRNICECNSTKEGETRKADNSNIKRPENILKNGACKQHDLYHVYTYGRMGATLYWSKYWDESNTRGIYFKYELEELEEMSISDLVTINSDIKKFNRAVTQMMSTLPVELKYRYGEWSKEQKEASRREALGYNKTLGNLLEDNNPQIVRLAKGIKKELNK